MNILSFFHRKPERNGRTDRFAILISRVSVLMREKKFKMADGCHFKNHFLAVTEQPIVSFQ